MKWAKVNQALRDSFAAAVNIEPAEHKTYMLIELMETDTFHPWDTDGQLCKLTEDLEGADQDRLEEAAWQCICEMEERVHDWFADAWNHGPGYVKPTVLNCRAEVAMDVFMRRLDDLRTMAV